MSSFSILMSILTAIWFFAGSMGYINYVINGKPRNIDVLMIVFSPVGAVFAFLVFFTLDKLPKLVRKSRFGIWLWQDFK